MFRKYHYLNTDIHKAAESWIGTINGELVCFAGVIQFPMKRGCKRIHRLVVLPDFQGIGIGTAFISNVADFYKKSGWEVYLTTSAPSILNSLKKSNKWILLRFGHSTHGNTKFAKDISKSDSKNRITYSFNYKPT